MSAPPPLSLPRRICSTLVLKTARGDKRKKYHQSFQTNCALEAKQAATVHMHFFLLSGLLCVATRASKCAQDPVIQTQRCCEQRGHEKQTGCKNPHFCILGGDRMLAKILPKILAEFGKERKQREGAQSKKNFKEVV